MTQITPVKVTTPVGRAVSGHPTQGRTTDVDGNPLVIKHGANAGQPKTEYYLGLAIAKRPGVDWKQESWGQQIIEVAKRDFPSLFDPATGDIWPGRNFAFKVADGDSQVPNTKGNKPCDNEGWSGNWVIHFSTSITPGFYRWDAAQGSAVPLDHDVKLGDFFQVNFEVVGNGSAQQPGVYLNTKMVCFSGYGTEIVKSAPHNPDEAGFGQSPLPAGASAQPVGGMPTGTEPPAPPVQQTAAVVPPPPPATDLVQPQVAPPPPVEQRYTYGGVTKTEAEWEATPGWAGGLIKQHGQPA